MPNPTIADLITDGFMRAAKGYKSETQKLQELASDLETLKKSLLEIKKFSKSAKSKYSDRQLSLLQLDQAVAALQLNIAELESDEGK